MKKVLGFIAFWIAVGMLLMLIIPNKFLGFIVMALFIFLGYSLFYCE